ncbi:Coagulation factor 5/8 type domain protein (fragment) [Crenothrix polyspora]|uniref:Coagulation factor 5/8 type domain protein n=1 Tax=Crenothrix polyspora TaxID=360316 RepID=A0A1R4HC84_9GAMM
MKSILVLPVIISSLLFNVTGYAKCTNNPVLQADSKFPAAVRGRLVYHSYINYSDGSSNLFLKDFRDNTLTQLNQSFWNIEDPMNAHFSPNGRHITFMGKQDTRWNIFIWKIGSPLPPVNLTKHTQVTGGTSEDPKFSSDGNYIVYKNNGDVAIGRLTFTDPDAPTLEASWAITNNGYSPEESMPYLSADGKYVYYSQGVRENSDLYRVSFKIMTDYITVGKPSLVAGRPGLAEFYPIVQNSALFFVGWKDATFKKDQIYLKTSLFNSYPSELNLNDCKADNSDPMPVDSSNIIFSSTRSNSDFYNLYLGNIYTGAVWSLNKFGVNQTQKHQLGATYSNAR